MTMNEARLTIGIYEETFSQIRHILATQPSYQAIDAIEFILNTADGYIAKIPGEISLPFSDPTHGYAD